MELSQSSLYGEQLFNFYQTAEATVSVKAALPLIAEGSCPQFISTLECFFPYSLQTHKAQVTEVPATHSIYFEKCQKFFSHRMKTFMKYMNEKLSCVKTGQSHSLLYFHQREHTSAVFVTESCRRALTYSFKKTPNQIKSLFFLSNSANLYKYLYSPDNVWSVNASKHYFNQLIFKASCQDSSECP